MNVQHARYSLLTVKSTRSSSVFRINQVVARWHSRAVVSSIASSRQLYSSLAVAAAGDKERTDSVTSILTDTTSLGTIARHGVGDAFITLNVGGKEFYTLRSTVNSNPVLADHVARAEANAEITKNGAVFIDRDPKHFDFILKYLRNRLELSTVGFMNGKTTLPICTSVCIDLPDDRKILRDLYLEASFYQIPELQQALQSHNWITNIFSFFNKNANPFDAASKLVGQLRAGLLLVGSLGTVGTTFAVTMKEEFHSFLVTIGLRDKDSKAEGIISYLEPSN